MACGSKERVISASRNVVAKAPTYKDMQRVQLIHWNRAEAKERTAKLRAAGYRVAYEALDGQAGLKKLRERPPAAVVIDLSRAPSQGRDVALWLRSTKAARLIPLVFVEGERKKVAGFKKLLPDATYTTWSKVRGSLKKALANPPAKPVKPPSALAGYSATPLPKKLGTKAGITVALVGAPKGFEKTLGKLPEGAKLRRGARGRCELAMWFPGSARELKQRVKQMEKFIGDGGLWIAWPKQASGVKTDLTQNLVRKVGLAAGLVDYKICAIDATWSGLKFARRRKPQG